jgi:anthranilate synthase component 1
VVKPTQGYPAERDFAKADYLAAVDKAKELIAAGDFMQVQVGQRIRSATPKARCRCTARCARSIPRPTCTSTTSGTSMWWGPRPRSWCARSASIDGREQKVTIRPLAGTPARRHAREGQERRDRAVNDPKERAEHVMLIDLARNDIGRIAKTGSVKVTEAFVVERYSHVMHIVSNVEGILNEAWARSTCSRPPSRPAP